MSPSLTYQPPKVRLDCPVCGTPQTQRRFDKYGHWLRDCDRCGHRFAELRPSPDHAQHVYDDSYFTGGGAGYPNYLNEGVLLRRHGQRYAQILQRLGIPTGRLLDVGAAAGFVLQGFEDWGWQGVGIEPNPTMAHYAQTQLGLAVQAGSLEGLSLEDVAGEQAYDLVTLIQVIAHFYDLQQALSVASSATRMGGHWLIETWNRKSWTARLLGPRWHEYSPPSVLYWFSPEDLGALAAQYGFREVARGRPTKWLNGAHAKSLLGYKLQESSLGRWFAPLLHLIPDRLTLPYPAEDLVWIVFEKVA